MPREFTDFTRDVAGGAEEIRKSLDRVSTSAKGADVSSAGLSDTQKAARDIARKYDKAMSSVSTTQETVGKSASKAARGLSKLNAAAGSAMATVGGVGPAYGGIAAAIATFQSSLSGLAGSVAASSGVLGGLLKTQEEIAEKEVKKFPWIESYKDELSSIEVDLFKMEKGLLKMSKQEFVDASVAAAGRRAFVEFSEALDEAERSTLQMEVAGMDLDEAVKHLAASNKRFEASLLDAAQATEDSAKASGTYRGEVDKASNAVDLLKDKLNEGKNEAEGFAKGLGITNGALIGGGVAAFLLLQKLGDLVDKFGDAAVEVRGFNVELATLERSTGFAKTIPGGLEAVRDELSLTRDQAKGFFEVLRDGANTGVVSVNELVEAGAALRETFGGDATERLREYVDLLEKIPTIKTDLAISASLDDKASALFALAAEGKIETVIDLQAAGLAGGITVEAVSPEDVAMLNAAQDTEKTTEDIHDFLVSKLFPAVGPKIGMIAKFTFGTMAAIGGVAAAIGGVGVLLGTQVAAQNATTAAVYLSSRTESGVKAAAEIAGGSGTVGGLMVGLKRGFAGIVPMVKTAVTGVAGMLGVAAIAFVAAGLAADKLEEKFEEAGDETGAFAARVTGDLSKVGAGIAAGAAIGSVVPIIGTAIGAVAGGLVALSLQVFDTESEIGKWLVAGNSLEANMSMLAPGLRMAVRGTESFGKAFAAEQKRQLGAGLALQRQMKATEAEFSSMKFQLVDLRKEMAMSELGLLGDIGGTAREFSDAVGKASSAVKGKFGEITETLAKRRAKIISDGSLDATSRRLALDKLNKLELDATREFVDAMDQIVSQMFKTPGIIAAGLRQQIEKQRLGAGLEMGGVGAEELGRSLDKMTKAAASGAEEARKAMEAAKKEAREARRQLEARGAVAARELGVDVNAKGAAAAAQKAARDVDKFQAEMDALTEKLDAVPFVSLVDGAIRSKQQIDMLNGKITEAVEDGEDTSDLTSQRAKQMEVQADALAKLADTMKEAGANAYEIRQATDRLKSSQVESTKAALALLSSIDIRQGVYLKVAMKEREAVKLLEKRGPIEAQLDAAVKRKALNEAVLGSQNAANIELKGIAESEREYLDRTNDVRDVIKAIGDVTKTEVLMDLRREAELLDVQLEYAKLVGDPIRATVAVQENINKQYDEMVKRVKEGRDRLAEQEKVQRAKLAGATTEVERADAQANLKQIDEERKDLEMDMLQIAKRRVDLADQELDARVAEVDLREGLIEAETDFLEATGAHFSRVLELQREGVDLERERLALMRDRYNKMSEAEKQGLKGRQMAADIVKQEYNIRKQEMGVQKDIFEKILGKAFGELRSDVGARRQRFTDQAVMGRAATRRVNQAGFFAPSAPGDIKTLDERSAERVAGGGGMFGGFGPTRIEPEEELAEKMSENEKNTRKTAESVANGNSPGSFYTADVVAHGLLAQIRDGIGVVSSAFAASEPAALNKAVVPDETVQASQRDIERANSDMSDEAAAGVETAPGFAGVAGAAGGGEAAGDAGVPALKFVGELTVKFNTRMFRSEVIQIMGNAINTGEVRKALEKSGVLFR